MRKTVVLLSTLIWLGSWVTACDEETNQFGESNQLELSPMNSEDRTVVRTVLSELFDGPIGSAALWQRLQVVPMEARRYFVRTYTPGEVVVLDRKLDLTSKAVLREYDAYGNFDAEGGFLQFNELTHDTLGKVLSDTNVNKRTREFTKGKISNYDYMNTEDAAGDNSVRQSVVERYNIDSGIEYVQTAWNQQESLVNVNRDLSGDVTFDETYAYQSHPVATLTLDAGGAWETEARMWDSIQPKAGWETSNRERNTLNIKGKLTLYQPVEQDAAPNTDSPMDADTVETDEGTQTKFVTRMTDRNENVTLINGFLEETRTTTYTEVSVEYVDKASGRTISNQVTEHETVVVTYKVAPGGELQALWTRWHEIYVDYVETVRTVLKEDHSYNTMSQNDHTLNRTMTTYRYTDNPHTRNNIWAWRSTEEKQTVFTSVDAETSENVTRTTDQGVKWLTDRYEADPRYDAVPFEFNGSFGVDTDEINEFFGDDASGLQTWMTEDHNMDYSALFGADKIAVSKGYSVQMSALKNNDGDAHQNASNVDGTVEISVNGASYKVSGEEWVDNIHPEQVMNAAQ